MPRSQGSAPRHARTSATRSTARGSAARGGRARRHTPAPQRRRRWPWVLLVVLALVGGVGGTWLFQACSSGNLERSVMYPLHYEDLVRDACARHEVDPYLACAIIKCESDWHPEAVSRVGARGLMQLTDVACSDMISMGIVDPSYDASNLFDPATNIEFGCAVLGYLQDNLATEDEAIAAYNAGIGTLYRWREEYGDDPEKELEQVIDYPETAAYLQRVREAKAAYQRLYPLGI